MTGPWVESPPHVDDDRMRHITDQHLLDSLDLTAPGLGSVATSAGDVDQALREWRTYRASAAAPVPVADIGRWARRRRSRPSAPPADAVLRSAESIRHIIGSRNGDGGYRTAADLLLHEEVDFLDSSLGRSSFYGFHYLYWMRPLLEAYALTGRTEYAARYGELFSQWYDLRDQVVGDWPGLDVIWYSLGIWSRSGMFNQAISLLSSEPAFTDEQWRRTMKCLLGGARWAAEEHTTFRNGNWQLVSVCELAHASSLYPEFAEHTAWRAVAQRRIEDHLELDFYADGGHFERSPSYHTMCLQALHVAALSADPGQWSLVDHPRLRDAHTWLAEMAHPAGWVPHLQDSHIVRPAELLLVGHHLYGDPAWKWLVERWMAPDRIVDRLDWLGPRPDGTDPLEFFRSASSTEPDDGSVLLRSSGYATLRQGWSTQDLAAVVNLGPYVGHELEPHSHHAALDFVISGWGEPLAWEAGGPPSYDDPGYYTWYQAGSGHNSVLLDGEPDSDERNTVVESFRTVGRGRSGIDVVAGRHDAFTQRHRRELIFIRSDPAYWLVIDDLGGLPISSTWIVHGRSPWRVESERRYVSASAPGLVVVPAEVPTSGVHRSGPARLPSSQADRPDEYGTIHGLNLARDRGVLHTLLVPFRQVAPDVVADMPGEGGEIDVRLAGVEDRIGPGWWTRTYAEGGSEQARWSLDPELPPAGEHEASMITGRGLTTWWCRTVQGAVTAELVTDRRATVTVHSPATGPVTVNGVQVSSKDRGARRVTLPSEGRWTVQLGEANVHG